ncbi:MAG: TIGR03643 family protein [Bacteroidetes bacterium]|nr:TIGR03643 family protein [Bacteroidota bacterium]
MEQSLVCEYSNLPSPLAYAVIQPEKGSNLSNSDIDRIIEMAWEDRTPFDAIKCQFGLNEQAVRNLMRKELKAKSYSRWRKRVEECKTKHSKTRSEEINRFKCSRQRTITKNRISKR